MKLKIMRNLFASDDNPTRYFIFSYKSHHYIHGMSLDMSEPFAMCRISDKEIAEFDHGEMKLVAEIDMPSVEQLDILYKLGEE